MKKARDPAFIRDAMAARGGLTLREMGLLVGCSEGAFRLVLAGKPTAPERARRIARVLRRPVDSLFVDSMSTGEPLSEHSEAVA